MSNFEVDSFKIRIPYDKVKILNPSLEGSWIAVNTKTGEADPYEFRKNSLHIVENGIKVKYAIEKMMLSSKGPETFIIILINSKILRGRYLEGITSKNIVNVYSYLMKQKVIDVEFDTFIKCEITDVDFKKDVIKSDIDTIINGLYAITREQTKGMTKKYLKKMNKGIEWSKRSETDLTKPFLKMYHKGIELKNHSKEFYGTYLTSKKLDKLDNMFRLEFTVKNKVHFRRYGIKDTSLSSILNLSNEIKQQMLIDIAKTHLDLYEVKPVKIKTKLNPNDRIILTSISLIVNGKLRSSETLIKELTEDIENRSQRSQKRNELKVLYEKHLKPYMLGAEKQAKIREEIFELLNS